MKTKEKFTPLEICREFPGKAPLNLKTKKNEFNLSRFLTGLTSRGFTLIEMLVAVSVFSLIVVAISGVFISGISAQRRALASQALLDQASYVLEFMSRPLRMAGKETTTEPVCLSQKGLNYEVGFSNSSLKFINRLEGGDCQRFFLENGQLKYERKIGTPSVEKLSLTSDSIEITSLKFNVDGASQGDDLQPRVTIFLDMKWKSVLPLEAPEIKIQTTVSQRNLDTVY